MTQSFSVRSAEDLFGLLAHPEAGIKIAVIKHIISEPGRAKAYGNYENRDLSEELTRLYKDSRWDQFKLLVMHALIALDAPETVRLYEEELWGSTDLPLLILVAKRLKREPEAWRRRFALLLFDKSKDKVRITANLMRDCADLNPQAQVQVALYAVKPLLNPPTFEAQPDLWLEALAGPRAERAQDLLKTQDSRMLTLLSEHWRQLSAATFDWLLSTTIETAPDVARRLINAALTQVGSDFAGIALGGVSRQERPQEFASLVEPYLGHSDPLVRLAALRSGALTLDLKSMALDEALEVRLAAISRLPRAHGEEALPTLMTLLEDEKWQVRAAATNAVVRIGRPAVETVKPMMQSPNAGARTAAAQILTQLDETLWLETLLA